MNRCKEFFKNNLNIVPISKWHHYFDIYDRHFFKYKNTNPTILEIGTYYGGGSEMLNYYFENKCNIVTIDVDIPLDFTVMKKHENIKFFQGNQTDIVFLNELKSKYNSFDIIIDDGGHSMKDQIISFKNLYYHLSDNGTYLIEDVHTSYWPSYGGGVEKSNTFIEFTKKLIDRLNVWHWQQPFLQEDLIFCKKTDSIHYHDSIIVIEKRPETNKPICEGKGFNGRIWDDNANWLNNLKK